MGRLVVEQGLRVALAPYVVTNTVSEPSLRALLLHELRWARTIRTVRPASYAGIVLTYPLPLAVLYAALARDRRRALTIVALAALARLAMQREAQRALGTQRRASPLLIPLRDALGVCVWALGLAGRSVRWRDAAFHVERRGDIVPLAD
jgi:ceramide glucosyltransferase